MTQQAGQQPDHSGVNTIRFAGGLTLVIVGLVAQFPAADIHFVKEGAVGLVLCTIGLALCMSATRRPLALSLFGLVPFLGPFFPLASYPLDKLPERFRCLRTTVKGVVLLLVIGIPISIAHSCINDFAIHSRRGEVRWNLGRIYEAERAYYKTHKRYGTFEEIGFEVAAESGRYTYRIGGTDTAATVVRPRKGSATPENTVVRAGISPDGQHFTATATGNIDDDHHLDQWHINDARRDLQNPDVSDIEH